MEKPPDENHVPDPDSSEDEKLIFRVGMSPTDSNKKIGPVRSHLYNYTFAKAEATKGKDSKIIFRVDDTDREKHTMEKAEEIYKFFTIELGFNFDITPYNSHQELGQSVFQSERQAIYDHYVEELFDKHVAFTDRESGLVLFDIAKFMSEYSDILEIDDVLKGKVKFKLEDNLKHGRPYFPLMRSDKSALYHLASVVDDGTFGVTHVVRGQDKLSIAEFQEMVRVSLDLEPKKYLHTPMLLDSEGKVLGGAVKFDDFIKRGILPHALISYMISSGYGDPENTYPSLEEFIQSFDPKKIHKNNGKFDLGKLESINKKIIKGTSPEVYFNSLLIYLSKVGQDEFHDRLETDPGLKKILITLRRNPEESFEIMTRILKPEYEELRENTKEAVLTVLAELKTGESTLPQAEKHGLSQNQFFSTLAWILIGTYNFPSITKVLEYLRDDFSLSARLETASNVLAGSAQH